MAFTSKRFHLVIDAIECDVNLLREKSKMDDVIRKIAELSNVQIIYGPIIIEGRPHNPGLTAFAVIDYSHISLHSFPKLGTLFIDVFSCKNFDAGIVEEYIKNVFDLDDAKIRVSKFNLD